MVKINSAKLAAHEAKLLKEEESKAKKQSAKTKLTSTDLQTRLQAANSVPALKAVMQEMLDALVELNKNN